MVYKNSNSSKADDCFNTEHLKLDLKKQAIKGSWATVSSQFLVFCIQMIGTIVLARLLTPDDFGLIAMVTAFSFLFQNFGLRGFTEATIQSDTIDHKKISKLFWIHVILSIVVSMLFISIAPLLAWFYKIFFLLYLIEETTEPFQMNNQETLRFFCLLC